MELDDKSHQRKKVQARDEFVNRACISAALPLIRFKAKRGYSIQEIIHDIKSAIKT
ncbi:DUF2726 domain-containing protein [Shewanella surugensis]|uniref:DUF2726 domain-containing protein n=1 Tax=Shewanella surugensis TaxID=212020 RepID=A0ABT0LBM9_9GAMM|nr:DUF2726 domain-containing protein [Shewanella surugensis]